MGYTLRRFSNLMMLVAAARAAARFEVAVFSHSTRVLYAVVSLIMRPFKHGHLNSINAGR
jgi:hypothetical protein